MSGDKIIKLDRKKRMELFVKKMKIGEHYKFSCSVWSKVLPLEGGFFRENQTPFLGGIYVGYDVQERNMVFVGKPLQDIGGLGKCIFVVSTDERGTLSLVKSLE